MPPGLGAGCLGWRAGCFCDRWVLGRSEGHVRSPGLASEGFQDLIDASCFARRAGQGSSDCKDRAELDKSCTGGRLSRGMEAKQASWRRWPWAEPAGRWSPCLECSSSTLRPDSHPGPCRWASPPRLTDEGVQAGGQVACPRLSPSTRPSVVLSLTSGGTWGKRPG